ncbi:Uncharacterized protein FWK35_00024961, partial [Aphis craccivora]
HCEFDTFLDDALHDRLIVGLADEACQRKLMGESSLTFQKACERALDSELVKNQSNKINDKSQVNWIAKNYKNKPRSGSGRFKEKTSAVAVSGSSQSTNKSGDKSKRSGRALCYGIASAPSKFQAVMENILIGLENTQVYLDDIIICGNSIDDCKNEV